MNKFTKPGELAKVLGITTDALRKQRMRDTSPYEYEVIEGRVLYLTYTLPPSVSDNIEKNTTKKTKQNHYDIKSPRYWSSIGKTNDQRIRNKKKRIEAEVQDRLALERAKQTKPYEPRTMKLYAFWTDPKKVGNYWNSLEDYERSKLKKKESISFY